MAASARVGAFLLEEEEWDKWVIEAATLVLEEEEEVEEGLIEEEVRLEWETFWINWRLIKENRKIAVLMWMTEADRKKALKESRKR